MAAKKKIRHLDLFSGYLGFSEGLRRAFGNGYELVAACEIETACQHIIRRHRPGVEIVADVKGFDGTRYSDIDVLTFGSPCQDLSVAGKRAGLGGERSGLFFQACRIIKEVRPRYFIFENVPGLLSSWCAAESPPGDNGMGGRRAGDTCALDEISDLGVVLSEFSKLGYCVAYRCLDLQYFGVPQRRERVFAVGSLGDTSCIEILFEPESVCWNPEKGREAGASVTQSLTRSLGSGGADDNRAQGGFYVPEITGTLPSEYGKQGGNGFAEMQGSMIASTLTQRHDSSEDGCGRGTPIVPCYPIDTRNALRTTEKSDQNRQGVGVGEDGDPCPTLTDAFVPAIAFDWSKSGSMSMEASTEHTGPLRAHHCNHPAVAFTERTRADGRSFEYQEELAYALTNPGSGGRTHSRSIAQGMAVRRLTPRECERLQGLQDDWTAWGIDENGKRVELSDSARYRMIGNGVGLPVVEWIGRRIEGAIPSGNSSGTLMVCFGTRAGIQAHRAQELR